MNNEIHHESLGGSLGSPAKKVGEIGVIGDETSAIQPKRQELDPAGRDQRSASTGCCKNLPVDHRYPTMISEEMADQQVHQASSFDFRLGIITTHLINRIFAYIPGIWV